jgi:glycosyltransferase involved in cell wall biosynthesis
MIKKNIIYYTHTYFLDSCLETIQAIKSDVDINLIIELSHDSKNSTIININNLDILEEIVDFEEVVDQKTWKKFEKYFSGLKSIKFVVFKNNKSLSVNTIQTGIKLWKYINETKAETIHFDTISNRAYMIIPLLFFKNIYVTIHDSVPHKGEESIKREIIINIHKLVTKGYFFYSEFSRKQFIEQNSFLKNKTQILKLQPYSFITQFKVNKVNHQKYILFFGRISLYKGIDILLKAIPKVIEKYPDEKFVIAGKADTFKIDDIKNKYIDNVIIIEKHINIEELSILIQDSKFVVCPYKEATQSGVLMTAKAMGKLVIASNVGAFPEYINNNNDGALIQNDEKSLAGEIINWLDNNKYKNLEKNVNSMYSEKNGMENNKILMNAYNN